MDIISLEAHVLHYLFRSNRLSAREIAEAFIARIADKNATLKCFTAYDPDLIIDQAMKIDAEKSRLGWRPLAGVPFAAKDVLDTFEYPTAYGSSIYHGFQPASDAGCIRTAKDNGAILLGKVATGEFATQTPSRARNPRRLSHTPGGSSSGSASAVGAHMASVAFGTQTTASVVRPAVFCGLVGYKPTYGLLGTAGMKSLSHTQDTIGIITRSVRDASFFTFGLFDSEMVKRPLKNPKIAVCYSRQWDYLDDQMVNAIDIALEQLTDEGASVTRIRLPDTLEYLSTQQARLFQFEARQNLAHEFHGHHAELSERLRLRLDGAPSISLDEYLGLRRAVLQAQMQFQDIISGFDCILYPAARGEAPEGLENAGDPRFGAIWSLLQVPSIPFPIADGATGLPLGIQAVGRFGNDPQLLKAAMYITDAISYSRTES